MMALGLKPVVSKGKAMCNVSLRPASEDEKAWAHLWLICGQFRSGFKQQSHKVKI